MKVVIEKLRGASRNPVAIISIAMGAILFLQIFDLLIPLIRLGVLLLILAALVGLVYACVRLVVIARSPHPEFANTNSLGWVAAGIGFGGMAIVGSIVLGLLPTSLAAIPEAESERLIVAPKSDRTTSGSESAAHSQLSPNPRIAPPPRSATAPQRTRDDQLTEAFIGALVSAAKQQQQQPPNREQGPKWLTQCWRCGGAGTYRYVDGQGVLRAQHCPRCYGTGQAR
jgi:hypothetical protein